MSFGPLTSFRSYLHRRTLRRHLQTAQAELRTALPHQKGILLDRLGDLHMELGDEREALIFFGGAIDACLSDGHFDSAAALCRKMVSICPQVVRAHGTLGCLLLARGSIRQAEWELVQYVQAARREGTAGYARLRLRMLVQAFAEHDARLLLARLLREMGDAAAARDIENCLELDLSPKRQRRMLSSLLRRNMLPGFSPEEMDSADPIEVEDELPIPGRVVPDLPLLDTSVVRHLAPPSAPIRPPSAVDLPFLDVTLAEEVTQLSAPEPAPAEEPHPALSPDDCARLADTIVGALRQEIVIAEVLRMSSPTYDEGEAADRAHRAPPVFLGPRSLKLRLSPDGQRADEQLN